MRDEPDYQDEKLFQAIFDQKAVGVAHVASRTGEVLRINRKYCDIVGYTSEEMEKATFERITHPDDLHADRAEMGLLLDGKVREYSLEKRYYRRDGSVVWVNITVSPLWREGEEPTSYIEVAQEITEMKRTEEALKQAQARLLQRPDDYAEETAEGGAKPEEENAGAGKAENALSDRERLLSRAVSLTRVGTWVWDIDVGAFHVSSEFLNFHGMNNPVTALEEMFSLVPQEDRPIIEKAVQQALESTKPYDVEHRVIRPNSGETYWVHSRGVVIRDESGKPIRMEGALQDITDRKLAEAELVKSEERLRLAMAASTDGVWDWNISADEVYRSPSFYTMLGYTPSEICLKPGYWMSLVHPDDVPGVSSVIKECRSGARDRFEMEFRMIHKTSRILWILSRGEVVERDAGGKAARMVGTHTDITLRKEAEQELKESEERYRAVIENAGVGIDLVDRDGRFVRANQALSDMLGYTEAELRQLTIQDITHPEDKEISSRKLAALYRGDIDSYKLEKRYLKKDGSILWADLSTTAIRDRNGEYVATIGIIADITERKKAEKALKESEARFRLKLDSIISPRGDIGILELADVVDIDAIQTLMDDFYKLTNIGVGIVDLKGNVLATVGWQEICTEFHRVHPEAAQNCRESDVYLSSGVEEGSFKLYRCKNNLWDMVTPMFIGGKHLGNLFLGQFFFDDESPDYDLFRAQAKKYGFDEERYLSALERVPRWSRETVQAVMQFYTKLTHLLSDLSYSNIKLARTLAERDRLVASVQEGEAKYRRLFANSPVGIISTDTKGNILEVNPKLLNILGSPSAEATKSINMFSFPPLRESGLSRAFEKCISTGRAFSTEAPYKSKWGKGSHLRALLTPIIDEEDRVQGCQAVVEDVTDRKRARQALLESEARFRTLIERAPIAIAISRNTKFMYANQEFLDMFGFHNVSELIGQPIDERVAPEVRTTFAHRARRRQEGLSAETRYEALAVPKEGEPFPVLAAAAQVNLADGPATIGFFQDITYRKRAEEQLQRNLDALKQSETIASLGYFERNWQTGEGYWSDGFCRILGRQPGNMLSHADFMAYVHDDDRDRVDAHVRSCLKTGEPMNIEFRIVQEGGCIVTIHGVADTTYDALGNPLLTQGTFRDITNHVSLQEQLRESQKMEAVGTLAGGISHDFNNILHIISGHAEFLETELAERDMKFGEITEIRRAVDRGAELVKQILTFSRRVDTRFELTDLNEDVKNAQKLLSRTIPKMIEIDLKLEKDLRPVRADSTQIEQTIINLAVNAKDSMPGGGTLTIKTENVYLDEHFCRNCEDLASGHYVLLEVSDTGHGMREEVLQHVFEPFFTTKELSDGTGLGLATVFGIVKMHRGHIACESEVGKGTAFSIYLPAAEGVKAQIEREEESQSVTGGTETILVVDDEKLIRNLATRILEKAGYSVITAESGKEAVEIYKNEPNAISLILLDLIMPEMSGERCLEELLRIEPEVKVLMASGFAAKGDTKTFLESRAKGTLNKPFHMEELLSSVRHALDDTDRGYEEHRNATDRATHASE